MRKVTEETANALFDFRAVKKGNTEVDVIKDERIGVKTSNLFLHGNLIASYKVADPEGPANFNPSLVTSCSGWDSPTTRERLNGILTIARWRGIVKFDDGYRRHKGKVLVKISGIETEVEDLGKYHTHTTP